MKTAKELIAELRDESAFAELVMLAVGFPNETRMINATLPEDEALETLNALVMQGGRPLGFIRSRRESNDHTFECRPLGECADDPEPGRLLQEIIQRMGEEMERCHGVYPQRMG